MKPPEWLSIEALRGAMKEPRPSATWIRNRVAKCHTKDNARAWPRKSRCRITRCPMTREILAVKVRADAALDVPTVRRGRKPKAK